MIDLLRDTRISFGVSEQSDSGQSTFTRLVIRVSPKIRGDLHGDLLKHGIEAEAPYFAVLQKIYELSNRYPTARRLVSESLALPVHNRLTEKKIHKIVSIIKDCVGRA